MRTLVRSIAEWIRKERIVLPVILFTLLLTASGRGQITSDTVRGIVGREVDLPLVATASFAAGRSIEFQATMQLENPTVFFPEVFVDPSGQILPATSLTRMNDSIYDVHLSFDLSRDIDPGDTLMILRGECLAGSDSTCRVTFREVRLNEGLSGDVIGLVISESIGPRFPYVRVARLDPGRPNPTQPGTKVTWGFVIDKESEVTFRIYDLVGRLVAEQNLGMLDHGVYVNSFTPGFDFPSGMFFVRLITNSGDAYQIMHVLR